LREGRAFEKLCLAIQVTISRGEEQGGEPRTLARLLNDAVARFEAVTTHVRSTSQSDAVLANATAYLEATGHIVVAWMWLEQFLVAQRGNEAFYEGKRQAARFFFRYELPRIGPLLDRVDELDRTALDMDIGWF
jgi:hypothetical protein